MRRTTTLLVLFLTAACAPAPRTAVAPAAASAAPRYATLVPMPTSVRGIPADSFVISDSTRIVVAHDSPDEVQGIARQLSALLAPAAARGVTRLVASQAVPPASILLGLTSDSLGDEGYTLTADRNGVALHASAPAGIFRAMQTLRQLLPVAVEHRAVTGRRLVVPGVQISDHPRYAWRGAMLDVARHFLPADDVKRFIDVMALYKLNRLHLHLSDDQGWRLEIRSWPNLAHHGGSRQVGGGEGGYYTQGQYADLVAYAAERYITIVPEIDMPGHTNAALASYPELNCDDRAPPLYTGTRVGFSALCASRDTVYRFIDDVVREISVLTPGPYFHIGGDEVEKLPHDEYLRFVERVEGIVRGHGKQMIGWGEVAAARLDAGSIVQHWRPARTRASDSTHVHAARGGQAILSPAHRTYLDMKYDSSTVLGYTWAAVFDVRDAYDWDPDSLLAGVSGRAVLGVEGPLWSETIERRSDFEFLAFPRLIALAEVGWSRQMDRRWEEFRLRLGVHGARLAALGINFHRSVQVQWRE
ncbi:MAG: beta-N-acetylhexosaminidase [Gemmatimonadetes bacterium]|nr:beta-N-acetylhexosaminidase [Gemmatimonadota bacterium]